MYAQIKSSNGYSLIPVESRLLAERKIFVEGEITAQTANEFVKNVLFLNMENQEKPIDILINSKGGEINSGMLMYDIIQSSKAPVRTFCVGQAYSMAAILLACGSHGRRFILPHGETMIHEPILATLPGGSASSLKSVTDSLMEVRRQMNMILAKHTEKSIKAVEKAASFDHFMSPQESIAFGLCDEIADLGKLMEG